MNLPDEILITCFSFLSPFELARSGLVSHQWYSCSGTQLLWKHHVKSWTMWPEGFQFHTTQSDWKETFIKRHSVDQLAESLIKNMTHIRSRDIAQKQLLDYGILIQEKLETLLKNLPPTKRGLATEFWLHYILQAIHTKFICQKWFELVAQKDPFIEMGAILIAQWEEPTLEAQTILYQLDKMGEELKVLIEGKKPTTSKALLQVINYYFFDVKQFRGNVGDYYNKKNSFINFVLENKLGLPISLSVIYAAVCRRAGVKINMLNVPRHFLVSYGVTGEETVIIDVFNNGSFMDSNNFLREYIQPVSPQVVWTRMLNNLIMIEKNDTATHLHILKVIGYKQQILAIDPDPYYYSQLALVNARFGAYGSILSSNQTLTEGLGSRLLILTNKKIQLGRYLQLERSRESNLTSRFSVGEVFLDNEGHFGVVLAPPNLLVLKPLYTILGSDSEPGYMAEENMNKINYQYRFEHEQLWRYFDDFDETTRTFIPVANV